MIVIDASSLVDFLLGRPAALDVLERELAGREQQPLHAPELIEPECLDALRRMALAGTITDLRAGEAARDLGAVRMVRYPHAPLRARAWELRHRLTAYDATYLALAEALDAAVLLTGDGGLAVQARRSLGEHAVRMTG